jgi:two-component system, NtrC family, response regulator HydG
MQFASERVVLFDTVAWGLLRAQLIGSLGLPTARALLLNLGFTHGQRVAATMRHALAWADEREWRVAGGRLHRLQGMVSFQPVAPSEATPGAFAEAIWPDSYEAEQHLLHVGQASECTCWTLVGFASGYLSFVNQRRIYCLETKCQARGDAVCRMVGRPKEDWPESTREALAAYEAVCLEKEVQRLADTVKRAERRLKDSSQQSVSDVPGGLVSRSEAMRNVVAKIKRVANVDTTVLLHGESGTGKERLAKLLHSASPRQGGPFVAINCAAMPEALLESELFGHAKGAFTGAMVDRAGLFESAKGGTLLLDEIAEMPLPMQAKLLRVLQEREVRRLGENKTRPIDVRLVAATHRHLATEVSAGRFREDLAFRLRVVELTIPPLRERTDDIAVLARQALLAATERAKLPTKELSPETMRRLLAYPWPGNVRELINAMERAAVLSEGRRIETTDLPDEIQRPVAPLKPAVGHMLADVEREVILATLQAEGGHRARTAQRLGIGQATLFRKLKAYDL